MAVLARFDLTDKVVVVTGGSRGLGRAMVQGMDTDDFPVESVSWNDVQKFIEKLNALPAERNAGETSV